MYFNSKHTRGNSSFLNRDRWSASHWYQADDGVLYEEYWCVGWLSPFSSNHTEICGRDYVPLVNLIGIYFQIRDDLMNLLGTEVRTFLLLTWGLCHSASIICPSSVKKKTVDYEAPYICDNMLMSISFSVHAEQRFRRGPYWGQIFLPCSAQYPFK